MCRLHGIGERKFKQMFPVPWPVWPLKVSISLDPKGSWLWKFVCSIGYLSTAKFIQMMTLGWPWPMYGKVKFGPLCIFLRNCWVDWSQISCADSMGLGNENLNKWSRSHDRYGRLKYLFLWIQKAHDFESLYVLGTWVLPSLSKWWPWVDLDLCTARSNLVPYAFVWIKVKQWIFQKLLYSMISKLVDAVN